MRLLWAYPSFSEYRVPVYAALDRLIDNRLTFIFSRTRSSQRVIERMEESLGTRAICLSGEKLVVLGKRSETANSHLRIPYQRGLLRAVLAEKADVVIGDGFFQWTPALLLKKRLQHVPLVINYQKTADTERNCPAWRSAYRRWAVRNTDAMVCNGSLSAAYAVALGMASDGVFTGGNPADSHMMRDAIASLPAGHREQMRVSLGLESPVFLYAGRMIPLKGVAELLRAWHGYRRSGGRGSLLLVGDGEQRKPLGEWARREQVPNVVFAGHVAYQRISSFYACADVCIMPTLEDNWSLVIPEAMACGLPVMCSRYNGCWPELVRPGKNGIVFDPRSDQDIINGLAYFDQQRDCLAAMGEESRRIEAAFTPERAAQAVLRACEYALTRGCKATNDARHSCKTASID